LVPVGDASLGRLTPYFMNVLSKGLYLNEPEKTSIILVWVVGSLRPTERTTSLVIPMLGEIPVIEPINLKTGEAGVTPKDVSSTYCGGLRNSQGAVGTKLIGIL